MPKIIIPAIAAARHNEETTREQRGFGNEPSMNCRGKLQAGKNRTESEAREDKKRKYHFALNVSFLRVCVWYIRK